MRISTLRKRLQGYWLRARAFSGMHPSIPYIVVISLTLVYTFLMGDYTIMRFIKNYSRERELRHEYSVYLPRYEADSTRLSELKNNKELIERIAREHYYMHLPGEEVFILRPDTASAVAAEVVPAPQEP